MKELEKDVPPATKEGKTKSDARKPGKVKNMQNVYDLIRFMLEAREFHSETDRCASLHCWG